MKRRWHSLGTQKRVRSDGQEETQRETEQPRGKEGTPDPSPSLTLRISPRLKLSSSSAVALKSYLAMASMLGLPRPAVRAVGRKRSPKPPLLPRRRLPAPCEAPAPSLTYREAGGRSALGEGEEEEETGH